MTDNRVSRREVLLGLASVAAGGLTLAGCGSDAGSTAAAPAAPASDAASGGGVIERPSLTLGFIKLTDMAPLAIAKENGYFADEGLNVALEAQANWKVLLDGVIGGQLDGAHMLAGQPLAATIGYGTKAPLIAPLSLDLNGNGITVSNEVWDIIRPGLAENADGNPEHPISAEVLRPVID
ncbi:MAG: ABC transporter substrate-binding protein, partial [Actinomycetota bacterium]